MLSAKNQSSWAACYKFITPVYDDAERCSVYQNDWLFIWSKILSFWFLNTVTFIYSLHRFRRNHTTLKTPGNLKHDIQFLYTIPSEFTVNSDCEQLLSLDEFNMSTVCPNFFLAVGPAPLLLCPHLSDPEV